MDWHGWKLTVSGSGHKVFRACAPRSSSRRPTRSSRTARRIPSSASSSRTSHAVETADLQVWSVSTATFRRSVTSVPTSFPPVRAAARSPSSRGAPCRACSSARRVRSRISGKLLASASRSPGRTDGGSPCTSRRSRPSRAARGSGRRRKATWTSLCRPARERISRSSASIRSAGTRTAFAGGRGLRSRRVARGSGPRTASSCSRPRPPHGRPRWCSSSRSGSTRRRGARGTQNVRCEISSGCCSSACRRCASSSAPRTSPRSTCTRRWGCDHVLDYRSVLF